MSVDAYEILGVEEHVDAQELRSAYRARARTMHPDINPDPHGQLRFAELSHAYQQLSDPDLRARIDEQRARRSHFESGCPPRGTSASSRGADAHLDVAGEGHLGPVALSVTLSTPCERCAGAGAVRPDSVTACSDCGARGWVRHRQLTLDGEILTWRRCRACATLGHRFDDPCSDCSGSGLVERAHELLVQPEAEVVPADSTLVVAGWGHAGPGGGPRGDLHLHLTPLAVSA